MTFITSLCRFFNSNPNQRYTRVIPFVSLSHANKLEHWYDLFDSWEYKGNLQELAQIMCDIEKNSLKDTKNQARALKKCLSQMTQQNYNKEMINDFGHLIDVLIIGSAALSFTKAPKNHNTQTVFEIIETTIKAKHSKLSESYILKLLHNLINKISVLRAENLTSQVSIATICSQIQTTNRTQRSFSEETQERTFTLALGS